MKKIKHLVILSEKQEEMLERIAERIGETLPQAIRNCIVSVYEKKFPVYAEVRTDKPSKEKEMTDEERGSLLCVSELNGVVVDGSCKFPLYMRCTNSARISEWLVPTENIPANLEMYKKHQYDRAGGKEKYLEYCKTNGLDPHKID